MHSPLPIITLFTAREKLDAAYALEYGNNFLYARVLTYLTADLSGFYVKSKKEEEREKMRSSWQRKEIERNVLQSLNAKNEMALDHKIFQEISSQVCNIIRSLTSLCSITASRKQSSSTFSCSEGNFFGISRTRTGISGIVFTILL
jgi:hypothetical protein